MSRAPHVPSRTLILSNIAYCYPGAAEPVLLRASATFSSGWCGIVGDNGCGKSTLARIACRLLVPDAGNVIGPDICAYCDQDPSAPPEQLDEFACDYSDRAVKLRTTLGIEDDMPWRFDQLSFGERKKLQVAVALWREADVLVLDEPTNHVDARTRRELIAACRDYRGIGLVISHDRELLDGLATSCLCFEGEAHTGTARRLVMRAGGYGTVHEQAEAEQNTALRARREAKHEQARLAAEQREREAAAAQTAARRSARHLEKKDHDGKGKIKLAIYTGKDGKAGKLATRMAARTERLADTLDATHVDKRYDGALWLEASPCPRPVLARLSATVIPFEVEGAGEHAPQAASTGLAIPTLYLGNRDHVGIDGPNGAGKSTFVRHLLGELARTAPDIDALVIEQELSPKARAAFLGRIRALDANDRGQLLSLVAQLNSDPKRVLASCIQGGADPSPGELRKLMLADGVLRRCPLIVMDEPTNHLDLHSIEALERALAAFPGALVLVSHDAPLLAACTTRRWHVEHGSLTEL